MENLIFCLNATIPVFLMILFGYLCKAFKLTNDNFIKTLTSFNYKITLPILLFKDIAQADFYQVWDTRYVAFCFLATFLCIAVIWFVLELCYREKQLIGELVQASYRGSAAILGIAFIQNIYGTSGMAPLMIIGTVPLYNIAAVLILSFTSPGNRGITRSTLRSSFRGILTNPIIWGIFLGMAASLCKLSFPYVMDKTIDSIASLATPLALLSLGAGFEGKKALARFKPTCICSFIKLFLQPALLLPVAAVLGFRDEKMVAALIMLGAPTTVSGYIMAKNLGHEGVLTSSVIVVTTFLSSISITFWLYLLKVYGLI